MQKISNKFVAVRGNRFEACEAKIFVTGKVNNSDDHKTNLTDAQLWALGLSAVLTEQNYGRHDSLYLKEQTNENVETIRQMLKNSWSIETAKDLENTLQWLLKEGHSKPYIKQQRHLSSMSAAAMERYIDYHKNNEDRYNQLILIKNYRFLLQETGIRAWDYGRYVSIVRWGGILNFYSEDKCWELILPLARQAQKEFTDWFHYGSSYLAGRQYWSNNASEELAVENMAVIRRITGNEHCAWGRLNWNTDLGSGFA